MSKPRTMSFISSGTFIGVLIVLFGISILVREVFHIQIPFFKILFGIFLIYVGVRMIAGGFWKTKTSNSTVFGSSSMQYDSRNDDYDIVFGSGTIDLFKMDAPTQNKKVEVS